MLIYNNILKLLWILEQLITFIGLQYVEKNGTLEFHRSGDTDIT